MMISTVTSGDDDRGAASKTLRQDGAGEWQSAWQREMEREQLQTWLQHPLLPGSASTSQDIAMASTALFPAVGLVRVAATTAAGDEHAQSRDTATHDGVDIAEPGEAQGPVAGGGDRVADADTGAGNAAPVKDAVSSGAGKSASLSQAVGAAGERTLARLGTVAQGLSQLLKDSGLAPMQLTLRNVVASEMTPAVKQGDALPALFAIHLEKMEETEDPASPDGERAVPDDRVPVNNVPLRFYTEANGDVAKVWIGADGSVQLNDEKLQQLGSDIQKFLNERGIVLESLTCNGAVVLQGANRPFQSRREEGQRDPGGKSTPAPLADVFSESEITPLRSVGN